MRLQGDPIPVSNGIMARWTGAIDDVASYFANPAKARAHARPQARSRPGPQSLVAS
jgi:hypothetical protein